MQPQIAEAPLTPGQEGIWYTEQLRPGSAAYNMPNAWRIRGPLEVSALERSINRVVQRHESLRTRFEIIDGQPRSIVQPDLTIPLGRIDLLHLPPAVRKRQADEAVQAEASRPFDLAQAPLLRATLVQIEPQTFILAITTHHIVGDGWSVGVLTQELAAFYNAFIEGRDATLPALRMQYADFARWEHTQRQGKTFAAHLDYWKEQLADAPPVLELPTDHPRPAVPSYAGDRVSLTLTPELAQAIHMLGQKNRTTLFMTLLAGFEVLLHRYTAQTDILVGSPIVHRPLPELELSIGYFLNNLVLRTDLSGAPTFHELLKQVRWVSLDAYQHRDVPYEILVQSLQPDRDLGYNPLFQVAFNLLTTADIRRLDLSGLSVEAVSRTAVEAHSKFDLTFNVRRDGEDIEFYLVYRTDLFRRERMVEMLAQYQHLLAQIAADPAHRIDEYSLVTSSARSRLPNPAIPLPSPRQPLVTDLVADRATRTPHHTAVSQGPHEWSYRDLVERADVLARSLTAIGVEPGDVVAIYAPRDFGLIVSMLATLSSGGVFFLIDPFLPDERKSLLVREAQVKWLISVQEETEAPGVESWLAEYDGVLDHLRVAGMTGRVMNAPTTDLGSVSLHDVREDDPAYLFFTSGSTGTPKGVLGCHKGLTHFVRWQGEEFDVGPDDRVAQLIGLSFDAILRDVFLPLTRNATLCLPDEADGLNLANPVDWFQKAGITILHTVPALAQTWLAMSATETGLSDLRCAFFSGEPLTDTLVKQWRALFPRSQVVNLYGPTETTMVKSCYSVPDEAQPGVQPAGYPMPQTQTLVLAGNNRLCGINEPGEIVVRTPFRTLGYTNAPEESKKRFKPNPYRDDPQDLVYYTGDLGCYRPDGTLAFLGRLDDQVKVRGVRIELGEIIAKLAQHPAVHANTVIANKDEQGQNYLVAYVVPVTGMKIDVSALRSYLSDALIPAMVPTAFVTLEQLPLLPTGKVDRRQLPEPGLSSARPEDSFVAPDGEVEEMLAEVWRELLQVDRVGVHDDFFGLGGNSLSAFQLINRVRSLMGVDIPFRAVFESPTIATMAETILSKKTSQPAPGNLAGGMSLD